MSSDDWRIVEGILTTQNEDGSVNVAPMGPRVDAQFERFLLRPFPGSRTYENLLRTRQGTFHITDDVEILARTAVGQLDCVPEFSPHSDEQFHVLADCCRWYKLQATDIDTSGQRAQVICQPVEMGRVRDFFGWNRAKHAILEAAILATRVHLIPADQREATLAMLAPMVEKTGDTKERGVFAFLCDEIAQRAGA